MIKDNLIDEKNCEQVRVKLLNMIRDAGGKFMIIEFWLKLGKFYYIGVMN